MILGVKGKILILIFKKLLKNNHFHPAYYAADFLC